MRPGTSRHLANRLPRRMLAALVVVGVAVAGCTSSGDDEPVQEAAPAAAVPLDDVRLAVRSAAPFERIHLVGLDPAVSGMAVTVDGLDHAVQPIRMDPSGPYVLAPVHPDDPVAGGVLSLRLTDGTRGGPALELTVDGLPAAPGAHVQVRQAMSAAVAERAAAVGFEPDELRATAFDGVPPGALPVKIAQTWFDRTPSADALDAETQDLLDRLVAAIDLQSLFDDGIADLPPVPGTAGAAAQAFVGALADAPQDTGCWRLGPTIKTAAQLSEAMILSAKSETTLDPTRPAARTLDALNTLLAGLGFVPGMEKAVEIVGTSLAVWQGLNEGLVGLYPTQFTHITAKVGPLEFPEDFSGAGSWFDVKATAASTGWSADATLAGLIMNFVASRAGTAQRPLPPGMVNDLAGFVEGQVASTVNNELQAWLQRQRQRVFRFCADTWTVDVTDLPYSTAQVLDRRFAVDPSVRSVVPLEVGPDVLRIAPVAATFGGRTIFFDKPIRTRPIVIDVVPDIIVVHDPGEVVEVAATIENAEHPTLDWDPGRGRWDDGLGRETNGPRDRRLRTPTDPSFYPFEVVVESTSRTGLRAHGLPPRLDTATVRLGRPEVTILGTDRLTPLASGDVVRLDGTERDGVPEVYPLVVDVQGYDPKDVELLSLRVRVRDRVLDVPVDDLAGVPPGRRRLDRSVVLHDFPAPEQDVVVEAELLRSGTPIATRTLDPLHLELEREGLCARFADVAGEMIAVFGSRDTFNSAADVRRSVWGGPECQYLFQQAASFGIVLAPDEVPSLAAWRDRFYVGQARSMEAVGGLGDGAVLLSVPSLAGKTVVFEVDGELWAVGGTYGGSDDGLVPGEAITDVARVVANALRGG